VQNPTTESLSLSVFESQYDAYLLTVRGLSRSTRSIHHHVIHKLLSSRFPIGYISWSEIRFNDFVQFLTSEFARLHNRWTQTTWLMVLRCLLRYLSREGHLPSGWDAALPAIVTRKHISLPRGLSQEQVRALWSASEGRKPRNLRDRALLLVFLRLGLRAEEVANISLSDIGWRSGRLKIRSKKTHRERVLPLPQDVGEAMASYLKVRRRHPTHVFEPRHPPFSAQRRRNHVGNSMRYLFASSGITDRGLHSLRHTAATAMVNGGASFKDVSDVLGHKSITTTLIYAKLDLKSLMRVALPWPGGAR
jgi:site-specific recombinase XerD